jgi:hypothetical protein
MYRTYIVLLTCIVSGLSSAHTYNYTMIASTITANAMSFRNIGYTYDRIHIIMNLLHLQHNFVLASSHF